MVNLQGWVLTLTVKEVQLEDQKKQLNIKRNNSKIFHLILGTFCSVVIYYVNYFFNVIIETQDVPYLTSIWGPQIILSMIIITNLIRINEK